MGKLNTILKENFELKKELEGILGIIKENEVIQNGFKTVEYAFLLSKDLKEIEKKPLHYFEDIFYLDKVYLCINKDILNFENFDDNRYEKIKFYDTKVFKCFFLKKKAYLGDNKVNLISEFNLFDEMGSYLISPIFENEHIIGSLNLYSRSKMRFTEGLSYDFIKELSFKAGIAIRKIFDSEFIKMKAKIDDLTNCYNKNALYELLESFMSRNNRYNHSFYFIMFDLDNFKQVNDKYGHLVGDEFLKSVGSALKGIFRKSDVIGRFGGDEFFMIIPYEGAEDINVIHDRVNRLLMNVSNSFNIDPAVSSSAGGIKIDENRSNLNILDIIKIADENLYKSKLDGKGVVNIS